MKSRGALILALATLALAGSAAPAAAAVLTESAAYAVADRYGQAAADRTVWADAWNDWCGRETPWRFTCYIEVWSEADADARDCWRYFDVVSPLVGRRLRIENVDVRWTCA